MVLIFRRRADGLPGREEDRQDWSTLCGRRNGRRPDWHSSKPQIRMRGCGETMQELKERIRREGKVLPGNIIKVDGFLNHRVDI